MGRVGNAAAIVAAPHTRRRRSAALTPPPVVPIVSPVPGTAAAEAAQAAALREARARPHILLDPSLATRPKGPPTERPTGVEPAEIADRIVAKLLEGSGPILLCVPGTLGSSYETSMLAAARAFVKAADGPVSVASIPYRNGILDAVTRYLQIGVGADTNVLALVLDRLRQLAPGRPILLTGESQGAWLIADTLRADPKLAATVTRIALFAKPGFVQLPAAIGSARSGAGMLSPTSPADTGIVDWRHTDDIVGGLFGGLGSDVLLGYVAAIKGWRSTGEFEYVPHHYETHGDEAARWLLHGIRPTLPAVHHSRVHRGAPSAP